MNRYKTKLRCISLQGSVIIVNIHQKETRNVHKNTTISMQLTLLNRLEKLVQILKSCMAEEVDKLLMSQFNGLFLTKTLVNS